MALSKINTNSIADDAVTTAKVNPAQTDITSVGTLTSFASTGIDDNGDATTMTIDTSENIGIGNTSPSSQYMTRLVVGDGSGTEGITIYSGNDATGRLEFSDATSGDGRYAGGIVYEHTNNALRFNTNGGNERLRIDSGGDVKVYAGDIYFNTSGKGIVLGATSNTDANTLDDYEEGTWTPTMTNITLSTAEGQYIKVGRLVTAHFNIVLPTTSTTNTAVISSLPFNTAGVNQYGGGFFSYQNTSYDMLTLYNQGETYCTILNGSSPLTNANISAKQFLGTIVYYSA